MKRNLDLYNEYLESCYATHYGTKDTTYATYKSYMTQFIKYLKDYENDRYLISKDTLKIIVPILERYINYCRNKGNHAQNIKNKIVSISSFYRWCVRRDKIQYHPFNDKIERLRVTAQDKVRKEYYLTWKQIFTVEILMEQNKKFDLRSKLLWQLFLDSGFRISAIHSLKLSQLDIENCCFHNVKEKMGKIRTLYFYSSTKDLILKYLSERSKKGVDTDYIFYIRHNQKWKQMSQIAIRKRVKKMGELIRIKDLYPHTLRKTSINNVSKLLDVKSASEFAGHNSTQVTENCYIQKQTDEMQRDRILLMRRNAGLI